MQGHVGLGAEHFIAGLAGVIAVRESVPREYAAQRIALRRGGGAPLAQQIGIDFCDDRGVLRPFHAPLDLKRGHAERGQLGHMAGQRQILERQRVAAAVRQAAGLGAQAAVARPLPDHRGQVALPGVAHAQRAVDEHLGLDARLLGDQAHLVPRALTAEHHARKAEVARLARAVERVYGHLGRGVQREIRRVRMQQPRKAQILHDQRVRARLIEEFRIPHRVVQLAVAREDVERDVGLDPARPAVGDGLRHLIGRKALRVPARVECAEAHIDRARARLHRRAHALGRARGRKQLYRLAHLRRLPGWFALLRFTCWRRAAFSASSARHLASAASAAVLALIYSSARLTVASASARVEAKDAEPPQAAMVC